MKLFLATVLLLFGFIVQAQEFHPDLEKLIANSKLVKTKQDTLGQIPNAFGFNQLNIEPKITKPSPGIYSLPQDGMPCIVPDTKNIAAMPNAVKKEVTPSANRIPNAMPEKRIIPEIKSWSK